MSDKAINIQLKVKLKNFQKQILDYGRDYTKKYLTIMANRQCGKSFALKLLCMLWMTEKGKQKVGFVTLTQKLGRFFYGDMIKMLPKQIVSKANSVELVIELINGSSLHFFSVENIETCRGFSLDFLVVDECAFAKETVNGQSVFKNILSPMLDAHGKKCIFSSTPFAKTGLFWEMWNKSISGTEGWNYVRKTIYDDMEESNITEEWIQEKRDLIGDKAFKMEYECCFLDAHESSYFGDFEKCFNYQGKTIGNKLWFGLDLASVGTDSTILTAIDENNNVKQWEIDKTNGLDGQYNQVSNILNMYGSKIQSVTYESNSIGEVMANQIKKLLNANIRQRFNGQATTTKTKPDMIQNLGRAIEKGEIHFEMSNTKLKDELGTFVATINPNTKYISYAGAEGTHDDTVMSLAICLYSKSQKPQASTPFIVVK